VVHISAGLFIESVIRMFAMTNSRWSVLIRLLKVPNNGDSYFKEKKIINLIIIKIIIMIISP
jgi:hypothetical protein